MKWVEDHGDHKLITYKEQVHKGHDVQMIVHTSVLFLDNRTKNLSQMLSTG